MRGEEGASRAICMTYRFPVNEMNSLDGAFVNVSNFDAIVLYDNPGGNR